VSRTYIGAELRRQVIARAEGLCEYCLIHEADTFFGCQVDHIISEKHGGATEAQNLAYACLFCNRHKGSDVGSVLLDGSFSRFFNPRTDRWTEHFALGADGITIEPRTEIGAVTARILGFNAEERLLEREALRAVGRYPTGAAERRLLGS
jgi:hypothetical protein